MFLNFIHQAQVVCKLLFANGRMTIKGVEKWVLENETKLSKYKMMHLRYSFLTKVSLDVEKCTKAFTHLAVHKYIKAVMPEHSRSTVDRYLAATEKESEKYTIMTAKDIQTAKSTARSQIDSEYNSDATAGMKRKAIDPLEYQRKRAALDDYGTIDKDDEEQVEVDEKIFFAVNYDKFNMVFRNDSIVDFATERINRTAGEIVKAFLEYGKDKMKTLKENDSRKFDLYFDGTIIGI